MSINPYESPQTGPEGWNADLHSQEFVPVPASISLAAITASGAVGGSIFIALMFVMSYFPIYSPITPLAEIAAASAASLLVLIGIDWHFQGRSPTYIPGFLGMLVASPLAFAVAFGLGNIGYGLGTKGYPGGLAVMLCAYCSFFLVQSLGGWIAIRRSRRSRAPSEWEHRREQYRLRRLFR